MHAGSSPVTQTHKICSTCNSNKPVLDFGKKSNAKDGLQSNCKICQRLKVNQHYSKNLQYYKDKAAIRDKVTAAKHRELLIKYLAEHPCVDCGNQDIEVLQFDHLDRSTKLDEISNMLKGSTKKLLEELDKCAVRCANCHIKRTRRQLGWWVHDSRS
jgi:hypothetical protein